MTPECSKLKWGSFEHFDVDVTSMGEKSKSECCRFVFDKNIDNFLCTFPLNFLRAGKVTRAKRKKNDDMYC